MKAKADFPIPTFPGPAWTRIQCHRVPGRLQAWPGRLICHFSFLPEHRTPCVSALKRSEISSHYNRTAAATWSGQYFCSPENFIGFSCSCHLRVTAEPSKNTFPPSNGKLSFSDAGQEGKERAPEERCESEGRDPKAAGGEARRYTDFPEETRS